jgi:hypothetical protein
MWVVRVTGWLAQRRSLLTEQLGWLVYWYTCVSLVSKLGIFWAKFGGSITSITQCITSTSVYLGGAQVVIGQVLIRKWK